MMQQVVLKSDGHFHGLYNLVLFSHCCGPPNCTVYQFYFAVYFFCNQTIHTTTKWVSISKPVDAAWGTKAP